MQRNNPALWVPIEGEEKDRFEIVSEEEYHKRAHGADSDDEYLPSEMVVENTPIENAYEEKEIDPTPGVENIDRDVLIKGRDTVGVSRSV